MAKTALDLKGTRQGCVLGLNFFTLVFDRICKEEINKIISEIEIAVMEISFPKAGVLAISDAQISVELRGNALKTVAHFKYFGSVITIVSYLSKALSANCVKAKVAFCKHRQTLTTGVLKLDTKF